MAKIRIPVEQEEEERRKKRLEALRASEDAFGRGANQEKEDPFYSAYEKLALDLIKWFQAENLDSRMAFFPLHHQVMSRDPEQPKIGMQFGNESVLIVEKNMVQTQAPVDAAEEAFAIAGVARATFKNKEVEIVDCQSDYELFLVYKAAKSLKLKVKNEDQIKARMESNATVAKQAETEWKKFTANKDLSNTTRRKEVADKLEATRVEFNKQGRDKPAVARPAPDVQATFSKQLDEAVFQYKIPFDADKAAEIQGKYVALANVLATLPEEDRKNFKPLDATFPDEIDGVMAKAGKTEEERDAAYKEGLDTVNARKGVPEGVPKFAQVAVKAKLIGRDIAQAHLQAQAAAKTMTLLDTIESGGDTGMTVDQAVNDRIFANVGKFEKDPQELKMTQALNHLTSIYAARVKEGAMDGRYTPLLRALVANVGALDKAAAEFDGAGFEQVKVDLEALGAANQAALVALPEARRPNQETLAGFVQDIQQAPWTDEQRQVLAERLMAAGMVDPRQAPEQDNKQRRGWGEKLRGLLGRNP